MKFLFVGEKRSRTAQERGWTWKDGRLAGRTLRAALEPLGVFTDDYLCTNILDDTGALNEAALVLMYKLVATGRWHVIAMGQVADTLLRQQQVPHTMMIHPAARGAIRKTATYQAHVASVLTPLLEKGASPCPDYPQPPSCIQ